MTSNHVPLIAEKTVQIEASASAVWEVLTTTRHIKEWDDVPDSFASDSLSLGSILEWEGQARLTVTEYNPYSCLRMSYHNPKWLGKVDGIDYVYLIRSSDKFCELIVRVGDWALAPDGNGKNYFEASIDFVEEAADKIKSIAER
jgi:uncharacterized protein YndB with AHSA1/START domain